MDRRTIPLVCVLEVLGAIGCARRPHAEDSPSAAPKKAAVQEQAGKKKSQGVTKKKEIGDLSDALETVRAAHDLPALVGAVYEGPNAIARGVAGVRKLGDATRATVDDEWHLGSDTKAMTATLFAHFVEEGTIAWTTTIAEAFPDWTIDPGYRDVTMKILLSHRGGAPGDVPKDVWGAMWKPPFDSFAQRRDAVKAMLARPPAQSPGTYVYANAGYMIVGAALERATSKSWEELMRARIFDPLQMGSCGFGAPGSNDSNDQPWGHEIVDGKPKPVAPLPLGDNPPSLGPAGTVHCNVDDWAKFLLVHLRGARDEPTILRSETMHTLQEPWPGGDYALGWAVTKRPWAKGLVLTHSGSNTIWFATVWIAPKTNRIFVAATNRGDDTASKGVDAAFGPMIDAYGGP
jgi:CubicO group peptidase (beta-lactamase class C family)